jgi:hypothetical protein
MVDPRCGSLGGTTMGNELVRPIDEASAKAIQEASIFGSKVVDAGSAAGGWLSGVLGKLPHNLVGIIDDQVAHFRARRWVELNADLDQTLLDRGVTERIEPSFTVVLPLIEAAIDENRIELKSVWNRLLANAYDPSRSARVRGSFIEIAKRLDPLDALILQKMGSVGTGELKPNSRDFIREALGLPLPEIMVSFGSLKELGLTWASSDNFNPHVTDKGNLFLQAVEP